MKLPNILAIIFSLLFTTNTLECYAETNGTHTTLDRTTNNGITRPKLPDTQYISCYYSNGILSISFAYSEGECACIITNSNTGDRQSFNFDTCEQLVDIEIGSIDNFSIQLFTPTGDVYFGIISCSQNF